VPIPFTVKARLATRNHNTEHNDPLRVVATARNRRTKSEESVNTTDYRTASRSDLIAKRSGGYAQVIAAPLRHGDYELCALREEDIQLVRIWRNAQMEILRQNAPITAADQGRYFQAVVKPTFSQHKPNQILLSLLRKNECIGYAGLTNIEWRAQRAEISFLLNPARFDPKHGYTGEPGASYGDDFQACLALLSTLAFDRLQLHRLFAETYDVRPTHIALLETHGFQLEGRMRGHTTIGNRHVDSLLHGLLAADWRRSEPV
jgi:RimJ/RimL family protein N-acetyltransferase